MPGMGGHPMSLLPPTCSGAAWPPRSYCSRGKSVQSGVWLRLTTGTWNPQGLSKSLNLSFFICKMGLTTVPPCAKGLVWKELRHSQTFTDALCKFCIVTQRLAGPRSPVPGVVSECGPDTLPGCQAVSACAQPRAALGSACWRVQPWDCSLRQFWTPAPCLC